MQRFEICDFECKKRRESSASGNHVVSYVIGLSSVLFLT
jgi:hypothetical protein